MYIMVDAGAVPKRTRSRFHRSPRTYVRGELLSSLGLVEANTLHALWAEARRQRRSLRQLLLAAGELTLYQVALIEAEYPDWHDLAGALLGNFGLG